MNKNLDKENSKTLIKIILLNSATWWQDEKQHPQIDGPCSGQVWNKGDPISGPETIKGEIGPQDTNN